MIVTDGNIAGRSEKPANLYLSFTNGLMAAANVNV
jgi:hypothetical protein